MARRLALAALLVLAVAVPVAAGDIGDKKASIDARIAALRQRVSGSQVREAALKSEIAQVTDQIRSLEAQVGDVATRLESLQNDLALHQQRLGALTELFQLETEKLNFLHREYADSIRRLNRRLVEIYEADTPGAIDVVLSARSFAEMLDQLDYLRQIGDQDRRIAREVADAKASVARARERTRRSRDGVAGEMRTIAVRTGQVRAVYDHLRADQNALGSARQQKLVSLDSLTEQERQDASEIDALRVVSGQLAEQIRAAQAAAAARRVAAGTPADTSPSTAGLVWPVGGPVTSPFGWRWGRMHEGIDIGAGYRAAIAAAAAGTVIYAGWLGGYGNLVVIDHGGGLATAYGHQSSIAVANGQQVSQGQTIGYVGSTGHSFGPHLHFEVRVNGAPVDPLGYV